MEDGGNRLETEQFELRDSWKFKPMRDGPTFCAPVIITAQGVGLGTYSGDDMQYLPKALNELSCRYP